MTPKQSHTISIYKHTLRIQEAVLREGLDRLNPAISGDLIGSQQNHIQGICLDS